MSHQSEFKLHQQLRNAQTQLTVGGIYAHYKHPKKYYVVELIGYLESTEELCVVYRALYGRGIVWVRTISNFLSHTDSGPRFIKIN